MSSVAVPRARSRGELAIWAVACLTHLLFWVSLKTQWLCPLFNDSVHRFGPGGDFFALYQAGYNAARGRSIYEFLPGQTVIPYAYPFRYLPVSAYTAGVLLTLVPPTAAYALWLGLCELCVYYNVTATYERSGRGLRGAALAAVWLMFSPFFLELYVGQFTFLLGTLLFWSVLAVEDGRPRRAGALWITSVLWKPASLLWFPLWLRERRLWRTAALCVGLLAANLVYFVWRPQDWAVFRSTNLSPVPSWHAGNLGLSGLICNFTGKGGLFVPVRTALSIALVAPALWVTFRRAERPFWLLAALWTVLYFLVYKDVWEHHLTLLLPFLVLALWRAPSPLLIGLVVLLALPSPFVFYDIPGVGYRSDPQPLFSPGVSLLHHAWRVVPLAVLYAHWLWLAWRGGGWTSKSPS